MGIVPGEHSLASTMEAFAKHGDVDKVLALMKVMIFCFSSFCTVVCVI